MNKSEILAGFNNHMNDFFNDVSKIFPDDLDVKVAQKGLLAIRLANPKLVINIWKFYIADKYGEAIAAGNMDFFLTRNYAGDLQDNDYINSSTILNKIDVLREPIKQMGKENLDKTILYMQNLTKLCNLYNS